MTRKPLIGITIGDPCGIGPEVVLRALSDRRARAAARFMVFGSAAILDRVAGELRLPTRRDSDAPPKGRSDATRPVPAGVRTNAPARLALLGRPTAAGGAASVAWIECAVRMALDGRIDAVVTAPISKEAIHKAGYDWPGHTEMIAEMAGVAQAGDDDGRRRAARGARDDPCGHRGPAAPDHAEERAGHDPRRRTATCADGSACGSRASPSAG